MIESKLNELKKIVSEALSSKNIIVDEVTYHKEGTVNFLEIVLDKKNGIDLDAIVDATNIINPIVDKMDFVDESYILDVVSKERGDE